MSLLRSARRLLGRSHPAPEGRRQFFRRAAGIGAGAALGTGLLLPDEAWAGVEERAARFGITPGTVVDAQGRPMRSSGFNEPFIGGIVMFGGNFAPRGWALCDGQLLPINQNTALFSILGTTYGGDGRTTFGLPDLRSRFPLHPGNGPGLPSYNLGQKGGAATRTLTTNQMPSHTHTATGGGGSVAVASTPGTTDDPTGNVLARPASSIPTYAAPADADGTLGGGAVTIGNTGGNQSFDTMPPYQAVNFIIALVGVFPSRN